jgi:hypothetical protein
MARSALAKFFIGDDTTTVSLVERVEEPISWLEATKNTIFGGIRGGFISGMLSGMVGAVIGAVSGFNSEGEVFENQLEGTGEIKLGYYNIPGIGTGPGITLGMEDGLVQSLGTDPAVAGAQLGAIHTALNVSTTASLVGAGVGVIREGWADKITRERILQQEQVKQV